MTIPATCENPDALEYQKCYKKENNAGCACSCHQSSDAPDQNSTELETTIVRVKNTREDFI